MDFINPPFEELPEYKCHKIVKAAKITEIHYPGLSSPHFPNTILVLDLGLSVEVNSLWVDKHMPKPGGYFIVYEDGYTSYSPDKAFETGYSKI